MVEQAGSPASNERGGAGRGAGPAGRGAGPGVGRDAGHGAERGGDRGSVTVFVIFFTLVALALASLLVDVGNAAWEQCSAVRVLPPVQPRKLAKVPFVELADGRLQGVVSSGSDIARVYVSSIDARTHGYPN